MATTYTFTEPDQSIVQRSSDKAFVPWDKVNNCPSDQGIAYRTWLNDGSPAPLPYIPPTR